MSDQRPLLNMEHISKQFPGVLALDDVDFELYPGEILGLLGENGAGKSTLVKILSGVYHKDSGTMTLDGETYAPRSPHDAQELGISTIYQELALVPNLTVAENVFLNREPRRVSSIGMVDFKEMNRRSQAIMEDLGVEIPGDMPLKRLNVATQQMVEIAKAVSQDAKLILMDEPTSALSSKETDSLFSLMRRLKAKGVSVIFISHRLEEVLSVVDRIIVMRDGRRAGTLAIEEATEDKIIRLMVGREVGLFPKQESHITTPLLEVRNLSGANGVRDVSFTVRAGEILGLAGLVGAGRTEVARLIFGLDKAATGEVLIEGKLVKINGPADAVRYGIGLVPEDRKQHGLILMMDVKENISIAMLQRLSNLLGKINGRSEQEVANRYVKMLSVATPSINQIARNLSGGNQQKVVLAKWLSTEPKILIMDEPTRGIDVGAKAEVHALMSRLAQQGMGIIMISSEMPEIIGMSDRVIVMCQGRVSGEFERADFSQEEIMVAATRFLSLDAIPVEATDPPNVPEEPAQSLSEPSN